jgi:hypothetical protein
MGLVKPCAVSNTPLNTGVDCQIKMSTPALILMVPASLKWHASDEVDFLAFLQTLIQNKQCFPFLMVKRVM